MEIEPELAAEPLRALRRGLTRAHGFALFIAVVQSPSQRNELITLLQEAIPDRKLQTVTVRPDSVDILDEVSRQLGEKIFGPVMVTGLEDALSSDTQSHPILHSLNIRRPEWPERIPQPVVLWVSGYLLNLLARFTPDFLDWRSDTLHFPDLEPTQLHALHSASWDGELDTRLPVDARTERIRDLESRIAANEHNPDRAIRSIVAEWLNELGLHLKLFGNSRQAIDCFEKSLSIVREIGDRRGEGVALGNLGNAYSDLGDARKAIEFYEQHRNIAREMGDRRGESADLGNLGVAYSDLGDARKAIEFYEQALVISREIGDRRGEGNALGNLGVAYSALGDARKAIEFYEQALVIVREMGDRRGEGNAVGNLGIAYAALGDARKAIEFYEQHLMISRAIGDRRGEGHSLWNSALALAQLGDRAQAIARAEGALQIYEAIEDPNAAQVRATLAKWRGENK